MWRCGDRAGFSPLARLSAEAGDSYGPTPPKTPISLWTMEGQLGQQRHGRKERFTTKEKLERREKKTRKVAL